MDYGELVRQRARALIRRGMISALSGPLPYYVLTEFPKSGGTWLGLMLSEILGVPFPRHRLPGIRPSILHGHFLPAPGMRNVIVLLRDGRDVMVSWYFHCTVKYPEGNAVLVDIVSRDLQFSDPLDVKSNLPQFIEYSFERQRHPAFSWADFVNAWDGRRGTILVRYEDLRSRASDEVARLVKHLTGTPPDPQRVTEVVEALQFEKMARRQAGEEDRGSFLRKGISGDWVNHFTPESRATFHHFAGAELIRLGYERDSSWTSG